MIPQDPTTWVAVVAAGLMAPPVFASFIYPTKREAISVLGASVVAGGGAFLFIEPDYYVSLFSGSPLLAKVTVDLIPIAISDTWLKLKFCVSVLFAITVEWGAFLILLFMLNV